MKNDKILLDHGSGGKISHLLTTEMLLPVFDNPILAQLNDGAILELEGRRVAFSTDSYTVDPIFFPGGNIGDLAINGTVNDVAMCGGNPLYLSVGLIIEEGFSIKELEIIITEMGRAAEIAGDGQGRRNSRGGGCHGGHQGRAQRCSRQNFHQYLRTGFILSGTIADHGITILTQREGLTFETSITSDSAALNHMVNEMFSVSKQIHVLRDPTRGGVGTALNEIAEKSKVGIRIFEEQIPLKTEVAATCELLGFDPLYLANEGKLLAFVPALDTKAVLAAIRQNPFGKDATVIGEVVDDHQGRVIMETRIGGSRIVDMLAGEQLPRIC